MIKKLVEYCQKNRCFDVVSSESRREITRINLCGQKRFYTVVKEVGFIDK